jgi:cell division transport system permease protein
MNEPPADKSFALTRQAALKRDMPLIPGDSIAGRALVVVIAIMTFLACLTAGGAILVSRASEEWRSEVLRDITIQIRPRAGEDAESLVTKVVSIASGAPSVERVRPYSAAESQKLLEPWLGTGLDLSLLPIPRIIVVQMQDQTGDALAGLRASLSSAVPQASLEDHRLWATRIGTMANAMVALAAAIFALMIVAMATAIGFATRGAVAANREIIEVLHFVGASDAFIAREFETHFRTLGFRGALIGGLSAIGFFLAASGLSAWWSHTTGGDEIAALFGAFSLGSTGYLALALVGGALTLLTGYLSRTIVFRYLHGLL